MDEQKIRVAIVDDHAMVREGLRAFLRLAQDIEVVWDAANGLEAVNRVQEVPVDVLLMDIVMPEMDGVQATQKIVELGLETRILALTSFQEPDQMVRVIDAGAIGYLQKDIRPDHLLGAIRQAFAGRTVLEPEALRAIRQRSTSSSSPAAWSSSSAAPLYDSASPTASGGNAPSPTQEDKVEPLTQREHEVLEALAKGMSNKEIAAELGITEKTVKVHVSHILGKLGVYDRTQAILAAVRHGLVRLG